MAQQNEREIRFGEIGVGYWGGNLVRNLVQMRSTDMCLVADIDSDRLDRIEGLFPSVTTTNRTDDIFENDEIDAVAIATPVSTHFELASRALENGKHVFVEKPMTSTKQEAQALVDLARKNNRICMVGHTFLYTPAVEWIRNAVDSGLLGRMHYLNSKRLSLGLIQRTCNVVHDLAPHDISIICSVLGEMPIAVNAVGSSYVNPGIEEVATITLHFADDVVAFIQNSWLDPLKTRNLTIVGDEKMVVYDDIQPTDKIFIHDKSVEKPSYSDTYGDFAYSYKYGDIVIPKLEGGEPIRRELDHFVECINGRAECRSSAQQGLNVTTIIEAINESIRSKGKWVPLPACDWV